LPLQRFQLASHFRSQFGVQVGQGFIKQEQIWVDGDGSGKGNPLLLPARKLHGQPPLKAFKPD
jgi:hypothetical protein